MHHLIKTAFFFSILHLVIDTEVAIAQDAAFFDYSTVEET